MSYSDIDPIISRWTKGHRLFLYTRYQDSDVRSIEIVDSRGCKYQIWIDEPKGDQVAVHVWDYRRRRRDLQVEISVLEDGLDEAYATLRKWTAESPDDVASLS